MELLNARTVPGVLLARIDRRAVGCRVATLIVLQGSDKGKTFKTADELVILGRGSDEVPLTDRTISRRHAELTPHDGIWHIRDLNSANGTTVNSEIVTKTILQDDDVICLGQHRLKVKHAPAISAEMVEVMKSADTLKMKNFIDIRRQRARRRTSAVR